MCVHLLPGQRRLRWLGHIYRMNDDCITKDIIYDEMATGQCPEGRPTLRFEDVCERGPNSQASTLVADDRSGCRNAIQEVQQSVKTTVGD